MEFKNANGETITVKYVQGHGWAIVTVKYVQGHGWAIVAVKDDVQAVLFDRFDIKQAEEWALQELVKQFGKQGERNGKSIG